MHVISASRGVGQERDAHFPPQISGVYADRSRGRDIDIRYDVRGSSMRSAPVLLIAFVGTMLFGVPGQAVAQSPHFVHQVDAVDLGTQLRVSGSVAGLGNQNIDVQVIARGVASVDCVNPAGNVAPGQRTTVTAIGRESNIQVKNGRANFVVTTARPSVPNVPTCPNEQWRAVVRDVRFTSFTVNVFQPSGSGSLVLSKTFTL